MDVFFLHYHFGGLIHVFGGAYTVHCTSRGLTWYFWNCMVMSFIYKFCFRTLLFLVQFFCFFLPEDTHAIHVHCMLFNISNYNSFLILSLPLFLSPEEVEFQNF